MSSSNLSDPAPQITLVIPCFNEAKRLDRAAFDKFLGQHRTTTLLFVDDGSTDHTGNLLQDWQLTNPNQIQVLLLLRNQGKAEAVRQGILHAVANLPKTSYIGYWDADLATPLDTALAMIAIMEKNQTFDCVMGSRVQLLGSSIQRQWKRHYLGRLFATIASVVLGLRVYDTQCGAKLFRHTASLQSLFDEPFYSAWIFDVELLARWRRANLQKKLSAEYGLFEFPLPQWHDVPGSKLRLKHWLRAALDLIRIARHYRH